MNAFAPRALLNRKRVVVELTPSEVHRLIRALEDDAMKVIENDRCSLCEVAADALLQRVAELREALR